jgi:drug/metabolite transporter (DMT)-like permease
MSRTTAILVLLLAAVLEAGGDAIVRTAIRGPQSWRRAFLLALGACVLFAYGWVVNTPAWDFGRLIGLYVVFFFLTAQLISWFGFGQLPSRALLIGGLLIVSGGLVIALSEP